MSNCSFQDSFMVCSRISARLRQVADEREFSPVAVSQAWKEAEAAFDDIFPPLVAAPVVKPSVAPKPSVPFEDRAPLPLPSSYVKCVHGMYDQSLCAHCLGTGASAPYVAQEILDLMDGEPGPEVAELNVVVPQAPIEAGVDDPEPEQEDQSEEVAEAEDEDEEEGS